MSYRNKGRKEMFYLTTHSTHFICCLLYGVGHMVKDHSDSEKENPLRPHGLLFSISSNRHMGYSFRLAARVLLYAPSHIQITHGWNKKIVI